MIGERLIAYGEIIALLAPSLVTALAMGMAGAMAGVFVLLRREGLAALALPQVVAVGAAIGMRLSWPTLPSALIAVLAAVGLLVWSKRRGANHWLLPCLYVAGLSLSFLIIAGSGQHVVEMQNLFTGMDVAVTPDQAMLAVPVLLAAGVVIAMLWRRWLLLAQAAPVAEVAGIRPVVMDAAFLLLLSVILLLGTSSLGAVMVLAMLFLPAATMLPWARRIPQALLGASVLAVAYLVMGFVLSVEMELPLSQSVGAVGFGMLVVSYLGAKVRG